MSLTDLVVDWGGFERLVASLHETGEVSVERDVVVTGRSGAPRQIDVLLRHKQGLYEHLVIAECKFWNSKVERQQVDSLATAVLDLGASRGVIFSTKGFQSGAITQAQHENIDLFVVRDLTNEEWGLPGRIVDVFLHVTQMSIGNVTSDNVTAVGYPRDGTPLTMNLEFGPEGPISSTPTIARDGVSIGKRLEDYIFDAARQSFATAFEKSFIMNGGATCTRYFRRPVNLLPDQPFVIPKGLARIFVPKLSFDLGIKIDQSRITVDRAEQYLFALAVENCVNGTVSSAARPRDAKYAVLAELRAEEGKPNGQEPVRNGSVITVALNGFFPFEETAGLQPVDFNALPKTQLSTSE
ncbi:hypothetical protein ACVII1_007218 [Bradyrhizobium elkanii]